jgi:hypothetical protein
MTQYVDEDFVNRQKDLRPIGFMVTPDQYKKYEAIARELYQQTRYKLWIRFTEAALVFQSQKGCRIYRYSMSLIICLRFIHIIIVYLLSYKINDLSIHILIGIYYS